MAARQVDEGPIRVLRTVELLCKHPILGLANKDIADALSYPRPTVCRDIDILLKAGWVEKLPDGKYAVTTRPMSLFRFAEIYMDDLTRRNTEYRGRVEAQARQYLP